MIAMIDIAYYLKDQQIVIGPQNGATISDVKATGRTKTRGMWAQPKRLPVPPRG